MDKPSYTTILHDARLQLGLTTDEYCVADIIYHLSKNVGNKENGWCYASKETIAEYLGIGTRTAFRIIRKLLDLNLIEKHSDILSNLRTTEKWYISVVIRPCQNGRETAPKWQG